MRTKRSLHRLLDSLSKSTDESYAEFLESMGVGGRNGSRRFVDNELLDRGPGSDYESLLEEMGRAPDRGERLIDEFLELGNERADQFADFDGDEPIVESDWSVQTPAEHEASYAKFLKALWSDDESANDEDDVLTESEELTDGEVRLVEAVQVLPRSVDAKRGIIRGVKLLGHASRNGRRYTHAACRDAAKLYEGASIHMDRGDAKGPRKVVEMVGFVKNTRHTDDGVYGDLHCVLLHPYGPCIVERAERFPETFGVAHIVEARGKRASDGTYEVESIVRVHSLDLTTRPATTSGLFEDWWEGNQLDYADELAELGAA